MRKHRDPATHPIATRASLAAPREPKIRDIEQPQLMLCHRGFAALIASPMAALMSAGGIL
jgi:hypothetical protein